MVCVFVQASVPSSVVSATRPSTRRVLCRSTWSNTLERSPSSARCAASGSPRRATWNTTWRDPTATVSSWLASHRNTRTNSTTNTSGRSQLFVQLCNRRQSSALGSVFVYFSRRPLQFSWLHIQTKLLYFIVYILWLKLWDWESYSTLCHSVFSSHLCQGSKIGPIHWLVRENQSNESHLIVCALMEDFPHSDFLCLFVFLPAAFSQTKLVFK